MAKKNSSRRADSRNDPLIEDPAKNNGPDTVEIETKIPNGGGKSMLRRVKIAIATTVSLIASIPWYVYVLSLGAAVAAGVVLLSVASDEDIASTLTGVSHNRNVAFVGNSYFYVNDLPRLVETLGNGHIFQDSCLHPSGSVAKIVMTGNGMYERWQTANAMLDVQLVDSYGNIEYSYDFGACTLTQLLMGYDNALSYGNQAGTYYDDGTNPCFQSNIYLEWRQSFNKTKWDYLVFSDQSKRMAFESSRKVAVSALNETYAPLLINNGITPLVVQPHAFVTDSSGVSELDGIANFTASIYEGALLYKEFLSQAMPRKLAPKLAPVGLAYLAIYEDDYYAWSKLFLNDGIHPSLHGNLLYALVIYGTIYKKMPTSSLVLLNDMTSLWKDTRQVQPGSWGYPTSDEASYLMDIAKKVAIRGYVPDILPEVTVPRYYTDNNGQYVTNVGN